VSRDAGKYGLHALQVPEHQVAEDSVARPRLAARNRPAARAWRHEINQALGLVHGQRAQQYVIEDRKDRDVRTNAERDREHGNGGHNGGFEE
jgi:hypothetical protein